MEDPKKEFTHTDLVRMYEASCNIDFPNDNDLRFRYGLQKLIAKRLNLVELKQTELTGPIQPGAPRGRR